MADLFPSPQLSHFFDIQSTSLGLQLRGHAWGPVLRKLCPLARITSARLPS